MVFLLCLKNTSDRDNQRSILIYHKHVTPGSQVAIKLFFLKQNGERKVERYVICSSVIPVFSKEQLFFVKSLFVMHLITLL